MAKTNLFKVIDSVVTDKDIYSELELDLSDVPREDRVDVKDQVGQFIIEQILKSVGSVESPIEGGKFKKTLSPDYRAKKKAEGYSPIPNLEVSGNMLSSLDFKNSSSGIKIGIFGDSENAGKADGHNNFSGESNLPERVFLAKSGSTFKKDITDQINNIILDAVVASTTPKKSDFKDVETKKDLYEVLKDIMGDLSNTEIRAAVTRSEDLMDLLGDLDLLDLL